MVLLRRRGDFTRGGGFDGSAHTEDAAYRARGFVRARRDGRSRTRENRAPAREAFVPGDVRQFGDREQTSGGEKTRGRFSGEPPYAGEGVGHQEGSGPARGNGQTQRDDQAALSSRCAPSFRARATRA